MVTNVIKVHALQDQQFLEGTLFRFKKGWTIRFVIGSSLYGRRVKLYTNYPKDDRTFDRLKYQELKWKKNETKSDGGGERPLTNGEVIEEEQEECHCDIVFQLPGTFRYYYIDDQQSSDKEVLGSGYCVIEPELKVGRPGVDQETLTLDCISAQTVLSKCLGSLDTWEKRLEVAHQSGYNLIHFTPIQHLGASNSAYSIQDQLSLNPAFNSKGKKYTFDDVAKLVSKMRSEWRTVSVVDIVLNHSANESQWLQEHPDSAYNCSNSPHLRPSYLLDRLLWHLTLDVAEGKLASRGVPKAINTEAHLNALRAVTKDVYLPKIRIHEIFCLDIEGTVSEVRKALAESTRDDSVRASLSKAIPEIKVVQDPAYRRFKSRVDVPSAVRLLRNSIACQGDEKQWLDQCSDLLRHKLDLEQQKICREIGIHMDAAIDNVINCCRYERIDGHGPKHPCVSTKHPLVWQYFTHYGPDTTLEEEEKLMYDEEKSKYLMAHNGWVMGDDPLRNFAEPGSNIYLRRELICWGDSVKLRFGQKPSDSPYLWSHMKKYVEEMARIFDGMRLDNCHSTPLHVAEYMIDAARRINPNLYMIAELFTSSESLDNIFVNRLGLNSLIRESMAAPDAHELGRLVYLYGGERVGAFAKPIGPLRPSISHAIFYDLTHDNPSPMDKRSPWDLLPTSAIVSMSCTAVGSNRGYDELVPHHIHVVNEARSYMEWSEDDKTGLKATLKTGMIYARRIINSLHWRLGLENYQEIFVDQVDPNVIAVTRHNPVTHKTVVLVGRTCFYKPDNPKETGWIRNLQIPGVIKEVIFQAQLKGDPNDYEEDNSILTGLKSFAAEVSNKVTLRDTKMVRLVRIQNGVTELAFGDFPPSSVIAFEIGFDEQTLDHLSRITAIMRNLRSKEGSLQKAIQKLSLFDLNYALFRLDQEERDNGGGGCYDYPLWRKLNYCGLAGIMYHMKDIRTNDDLGHPICGNLRDGDWMLEYIVGRLRSYEPTAEMATALDEAFAVLKQLPRYLIPRYFDLIVTPVYTELLEAAWSKMSPLVGKETGNFGRLLGLASVSLVGFCLSSPLPPLAPKITPPRPTNVMGPEGIMVPMCSSISAGFTHFATGYMRNWGRDTFISVRGLLLLTGRYDEARYIILGFGGTLRHGLIPNLLDRGVNARYNCRDAVWWWLQSIKDYVLTAPNGAQLLNEPVHRLYPSDDSPANMDPESPSAVQQPLHQVMQEALNRHFEGMDFIERNAGRKIDEHMTEKGFHIKFGVRRETGFVYGGNEWNCGTWMDKMGSSAKAGNKGRPSSPRDGSAIELVGLSYSVISWLADAHGQNIYPHQGVAHHERGERWTWKEWANKIKENFEKHFWIDSSSTHHLVNRRQIYKDSVGATHEWQDFQLRPNWLVTAVVAPDLFTPENARVALDTTRKVLLGPLGMKTLDPSDWNYRGDYINSDDSHDYKIAHGFNYHQGPEWLWLTGYYLRAILIHSKDYEEAVSHVKTVLSKHYQHIETSEWFGLPELTNSNGKVCHDSCVNQAWSAATLIETLQDLRSKIRSSTSH